MSVKNKTNLTFSSSSFLFRHLPYRTIICLVTAYLSMRNFDETIQLLKEMDERYIPADRWLYSLCLTGT